MNFRPFNDDNNLIWRLVLEEVKSLIVQVRQSTAKDMHRVIMIMEALLDSGYENICSIEEKKRAVRIYKMETAKKIQEIRCSKKKH